jgi:hypothetical protein
MPERYPGLGTRPDRKKASDSRTFGVCPIRGRVCYASRKAAKKDVKRIVASGIERRHVGRELHEFFCDTCNGWHIGH